MFSDFSRVPVYFTAHGDANWMSDMADKLPKLPPDHPIERLQVYRKMLVDCRDFLETQTEYADAVTKLDAAIHIIDQSVKSKAS
jgi:hypothetical protein